MKTNFTNQQHVNIDSMKSIVREKDKLNWINNVKDKSKLDFLSVIKPTHGVEPFVKLNISRYERSLLAQLRYGILQIQLETGRYNNEPRDSRFCRICNGGEVEDQYHFVFHCPVYNNKREIFTNVMQNRVPEWNTMSDNDKFILLFKDHSRLFARFVKDLFSYRKELLYK